MSNIQFSKPLYSVFNLSTFQDFILSPKSISLASVGCEGWVGSSLKDSEMIFFNLILFVFLLITIEQFKGYLAPLTPKSTSESISLPQKISNFLYSNHQDIFV